MTDKEQVRQFINDGQGLIDRCIMLAEADHMSSQVAVPIIMSSDRYKRMREAGYIDEYGQFTDKFQEEREAEDDRP